MSEHAPAVDMLPWLGTILPTLVLAIMGYAWKKFSTGQQEVVQRLEVALKELKEQLSSILQGMHSQDTAVKLLEARVSVLSEELQRIREKYHMLANVVTSLEAKDMVRHDTGEYPSYNPHTTPPTRR